MESNRKSARSLIEGESVKDFLRRKIPVKLQASGILLKSKKYRYEITADKDGTMSNGHTLVRACCYDKNAKKIKWLDYPRFLKLIARLGKPVGITAEIKDMFGERYYLPFTATAAHK